MGDKDQDPIILQNRSLTSADQDFMAGTFICCFSVIGLLGYIPVLFVLLRSTALSHPVYRLMISLGVTDCASLVIRFTVGIFTFSHGTLFDQIVIDWLMVVIEYVWFSLVCHVAAISFNRYLAVCKPTKHHRWFRSQYNSMHWVVLTCTWSVSGSGELGDASGEDAYTAVPSHFSSILAHAFLLVHFMRSMDGTSIGKIRGSTISTGTSTGYCAQWCSF